MKLNWGWRIAIVYTIFAVSTIGFVSFAMTKHVELVRKDYYEHSLLEDQTQAAVKRGNSMAESVKSELRRNTLYVSLPQSVPTTKAIMTLYRPSNSELDKTYNLIDNKIEIPLKGLAHGYYTLVLEWEIANESYRLERPIEIGVMP